MDTALFLRFISNILNVKTWHLSAGDKTLAAFQKECCFEATLQPMYTSEYLSFLHENASKNTLYEITDYLKTSLTLFIFERQFYAIGPYVKTTFSQTEMQELLASHKLPASVLMPLKLYYDKFPQLNYNMIHGTVISTMRTFVPNTSDYSYRSLTGFHEEIRKDNLIKETSRTYSQIIQQYEMENYFLRKIIEGDVDGVKIAFETMTSSFYLYGNKTDQTLYATDSTGFAIIRTLARKAAETGGASIVKIDEITQESIQKYDKARTPAEIGAVQRDMLIALTQAVLDAKYLGQYSPIIRNILTFIQANYTNAISIADISANYHISSEYLSRLFKKELGQSPTEYIASLRTKKAAELLKTSNLSITAIAEYVGYPDSNYFVKVFKKHYGMTPSVYKKA